MTTTKLTYKVFRWTHCYMVSSIVFLTACGQAGPLFLESHKNHLNLVHSINHNSTLVLDQDKASTFTYFPTKEKNTKLLIDKKQ